MTVERALRLIGGFFVLLSVSLGYWVSPYWFLFTAFVGLNLLQSGLTNWCPMVWILEKAGLRRADNSAPTKFPTLLLPCCCSNVEEPTRSEAEGR